MPRLGVAAFVAFVQIAGSFGAAGNQPARKGIDVLAVLLLLAGPAALALVRSKPQLLAGAVMAVVVAYIVLGYPYGPIFLSLAVALFWLIGAGHRRTGWLIAASGITTTVLLQAWIGRGDPWPLSHAVGAAGWLIAILVIADISRMRKERIVEARQTQAEADRRRASEERLRIAQELHDVLAHNISLINVQAGVGLHLMDDQPEKARDALAAIRSASKEALGELRSVLDLLRGDSAAPRAPAAGLDQLQRVVANAAATGLDVQVEMFGATRPLPADVDLAALRIAQEALTNITRHARASRAHIRLRYEPDQLLVEVDDDGQGGPPNGAGKGITGMRERAAALGGHLDAGPRPSGGFRVTARLPTP